jgi:hypothetical protein
MHVHRQTYAHKTTDSQRVFWETRITDDVLAQIFWKLRDVVDLRTTITDSTTGFKDYIKQAIMTAADDIWRFSLGSEYDTTKLERLFADDGIRLEPADRIRTGLKDLRTERLYTHLAGFNIHYFEGTQDPGFSAIYVHPGAVLKPTRTKRPSPGKYKFAKRQRTQN